MILRLGYDIQFEFPGPVAMVALLHVHPSRAADLRGPDELQVDPVSETETYIDSFGNRCTRFPVQELPHEILKYLYNSRYCEVDRFSTIALELFGGMAPGWSRVQAVCDWV